MQPISASDTPHQHQENQLDDDTDIAIIGIAGRFPGAADIATFWQNLVDGVEARTYLSDEDIEHLVDIHDELNMPFILKDVQDPHYVRALPLLDNIELFDASFFGYNPREAELLDPQQRLFLEDAWHALEDAGYNPYNYPGLIGVYAGAHESAYAGVLSTHREMMHSERGFIAGLGNQNDYLPTRTSYKLNLRGPSIEVQTACSTSLVAIHLARQGLLNGECDMALAGGALVNVPQHEGYVYDGGGMVSPEGRCRTFDAKAAGTVFSGGGIGVVVLKRLAVALRDGDHMYAVIKGSAIGNDGGVKAGFTAPSVNGQAQTIAEALAVADVDPDTISYVEAHGTGTPLGDPIEIAALTQVYRHYTQRKGYCAIGTAKTNVGHLGPVAGVTGVIKTALALKHRLLPALLHYETPNPKIDFVNSPFFVSTELRRWETTDGMPRRAGVSSFGVGGTNAHAVMQEAPQRSSSPSSRPYQLVLLSARTSTALAAMAAHLADHLRRHPEMPLADVAYTLQVGRHGFQQRRVLVCRATEEAITALTSDEPATNLLFNADTRTRKVVFMFSGQGAQYVNMGHGLYTHEPIFRAAVDQCVELLQPHLGIDLRDLLYPTPEAHAEATRQLTQTAMTQPVLFVIEYAAAQLLLSWGIEPRAMIGHSVGEYVAACLAGVFTLADGLALIAARGRLMQTLPAGAMLSVALPVAELTPYLDAEIAIAATNSPTATVLSGPITAIDRLEAYLSSHGHTCRRLHTSHAFHSAMMDPLLDSFTRRVSQVRLSPPQRPYISNVSGTWITEAEATNPSYWASHVRQSVRFYEGLCTLAEDPDTILLEVGPGRTLSTLARQAKTALTHTFPMLRHPQDQQDDYAFLLHMLGRLWAAGARVDWQQIATAQGADRRRVSLPGYPFERQRHWLEPKKIGQFITSPTLGPPADMRDWFYVPIWRRTAPAIAPVQVDGQHCLLFAEEHGISTQLLNELQIYGYTVTTVERGTMFIRHDARRYALNPQQDSDYETLMRALADEGALPGIVLHLWSVVAASAAPACSGLDALDELQTRGFYSLLWLAQALGQHHRNQPVHVLTVTNNLHDVAGEPILLPQRATLLGPTKVMPVEYAFIRCTSVDVALPADDTYTPIAHQLIAEAQRADHAPVVAYRQRHRWVQGFERTPFDPVAPTDIPLRNDGVYLITGGLGGVGLTLAKRIAETVSATLVLVSRTPLPSRENWAAYLANHSSVDASAQRIVAIQELEALGSTVLTLAVDVSDPVQVEELIAHVETSTGPICGIIHAAGAPGDGIMQLKTTTAAAAVLNPKVRGALVIEQAVGNRRLDFFVLCSSIYALVPSLGQVDYCGANNFLDIFAAAYSTATGNRALAINWGGWEEVGMAANAEKRRFDHPLVHSLHADHGQRQAYLTLLETAHNWVLDEHRLMGKGTVPATGYLELACFLSPRPAPQHLLQLQDVFFITPLMVEDHTQIPMMTLVREEGTHRAFTIASRTQLSEDQMMWEPHMLGHVTTIPARPAPQFAIDELLRRCTTAYIDPTSPLPDDDDEQLLLFGPRWQSVQHIYYGDQEALAFLELPSAFSDELQDFILHPALLDAATKFGISYYGQEAYLPLSYRSLVLFAPLPGQIYSYLRCSGDVQPGAETLSFDCFLLDVNGVCVVEIQEFTVKRIGNEATITRNRVSDESASTRAVQPASALTLEAEALYTKPRAGQPREPGRIAPHEGAESLTRALAQPFLTQAVVALQDVEQMITEARTFEDIHNPPSTVDSTPAILNPRPDLATPYEAPRTPTEAQLAAIWQRVLGIDQVSIHDPFVELGGDSVLAIQVMAQAKAGQILLTPNLIFQHQTIAALAATLEPSVAQSSGSATPVSEQRVLTPGQAHFFATTVEHPNYASHSLLLELDQALEPALAEDAWRQVVERHAIFRHIFLRDESGWEPHITEHPSGFAFNYVELFYAAESNQMAIMEAQAAEVQAKLDLAAGPLLTVVLFNRGRAKDMLLLVLHCAVGDLFSAVVLLDEMHAVYQALAHGEPDAQLAFSAPLHMVTTQLYDAARSPAVLRDAEHWHHLPVDRVTALPQDYAVQEQYNTESSACSVAVELSSRETQLLQAYTHDDEDRVLELVIAALAHSLADWAGGAVQWIELECHDRASLRPFLNEIDASRTVGCLNPVFPVLVETPGGGTVHARFSATCRALHMVQRVSYGMLRYLHTPPALMNHFAAYLSPAVKLHIIPNWDDVLPTGFTLLDADFGTPRSPAAQRPHLIDVRVGRHNDRFKLHWAYSEQLHEQHTITRLAEQCRSALQQLLATYREL